jgi:hypothetical protein
LSQADVDDVVPVGGPFRVITRVLGGTTSHLMKMPSAKDIFEYRRGFLRSVDLKAAIDALDMALQEDREANS